MISYNVINHGTYLRAFELARELVKQGETVTLLASTSDEHSPHIKEFTRAGVQIVGIPNRFLRAGWDPHNIVSRLKWIKTHNDYDIVHGFESRPAVILPAMKLVRKGVPLVLDWCDWFGKGGSIEERPNLLIRSALRPFETYFENHYRTKAKGTTVICSTLFERALTLGVNPETIKIIYNGFNTTGGHSTPKAEARARFNLTDQDFVIGYIGALFPKDAELMEKAFFLTLEKVPQAKLLHLGKSNYQLSPDEPHHQAIVTTGPIDEQTLVSGLSACDIFWLPLSDIPANWGRFPLKFSDFLTAGKPVFVTDVGDAPNLVQQHGVGKVCQPTPESIASGTAEMAKNHSLIEEQSKAATKLSQNPNHSWAARAQTLLDLYHQVLSKYGK